MSFLAWFAVSGFVSSTASVAGRLMKFLNGIEGVTSVESGLQPGDDEVHVVMDRTLAAYAGVNLATAASHVRAAVGGLVLPPRRIMRQSHRSSMPDEER